MKTEQIILIILLINGIGILLMGILIRLMTDKRNKSCLKKSIGNVVEYKFQGKGRMYPVIEFEVEGITYLTKKKYNSVKSVSYKGFPISIQADAYEDDKGNLFVKTGPIANYKNLAEKLWPIGKEMPVYYNPQNPKINYVERPIANRFLTVFFEIMGILIILLAVVLFFLISKSK